MRTCVVRRQFYTSEVNTTVMIHAEPGFGTPKAAICYFVTTNTTIDSFDTTTVQQGFGIGFMAGSGTTAGAVASSTQQDGAQATASVTRTSSTSGIGPVSIGGAGAGNSFIWRTTGCRFVDTGMLITFANPSSPGGTPPPNQRLDVITTFFTGADLQVERFETAAARTAGVGITFNVGFRPDVVIGIGSRAASGAGGGFSYGFATRTPGATTTTVASQGSCSHNFSTGSDPIHQRMRHSRYFAEQCPVDGSAAAQIAWECDSFNSTGFRLVVRNANHPVGAVVGGIAMKFQGKYFGSSFTTLTTTGGKRSNTRMTPQIIIGSLTGATAANALSAESSPNSDSFSIFVGTGGTTTKNRYGTGTMTVSSSATAVTGTGTSFFSQLAQGNRIYNTSGTLIGSVGAVNSNTSMTLSAGATNAMSSANFFIQAGSQHSIIYGNEFGNSANSNAYTGVRRGLEIARISGGVPSTWIEADFNPFNRRPSFVLNYTTADATPRFGWFLAIEDENRRSDPS